MKENEHKQGQIILLHANSKRMERSDKEIYICVASVSCRLAQIPNRHLKNKRREVETCFLLLFDRCMCSLFPLMKRVPLMLPSRFFIVPVLHHPPLPSWFSTPGHTYFWMPANLPSVGQEPRQTLSASCLWPGACLGTTKVLVGFSLPFTYVLPSAWQILSWV